MPTKKHIPSRNRSPYGWWIYQEVEQWVSNRQKAIGPNSRCLIWENVRIIQAKDREQAYKKAMKLGKQGRPSKTDHGEWRFLGLSWLYPIHDEMEDGAELLWKDRGSMRMKEAMKRVRTKEQLAVFDDQDDPACQGAS